MRSSAKRLWSDQSGAIAAVYALALPVLIAAGGIAFDYARMAALDTELQNAADQAALAAATQLDGTATACTRAVAAARTLITNNTLFANDDNASGLNVAIADQTANNGCGDVGDKIKFYTVYTSASSNTVTNDPLAAKFVSVTANSRKAVYALTPIVSLLNSGDMAGTAVAGLGSAICKVPPVMICNPLEPNGNTNSDLDFDVASLIGKGLKLVSVGNGNSWKGNGNKGNVDAEGSPGVWAPGNFGYLNTGGGSNGAPGLREALGWASAPGDCLGTTGVDTKPGATVSVTDSLNTRFDIYDNNACPAGGSCPPSINSVKDLLRANNANGNNSCRLSNAGWDEAAQANKRYLPTSATTPLATSVTPDAMGHPRDMCHAVESSTSGYCSGPVGDGAWDRDAYFRVNYRRAGNTYWTGADWRANTGLSTAVATTAANYASRYNVYAWEIANRGTVIDGVAVLPTTSNSRAIGNLRDHDRPICGVLQTPSYGAGIVPGGTAVDRRRISVAGVNCQAEGVQGNSTGVQVKKWIEVFLVEPSFNRNRTSAGDVYVEIIGETSTGTNGSTAGQVTRRDVPYLIE